MLLVLQDLLLSEFSDAQKIVHLRLVRFVNEEELILRNETLEAHITIVLMREESGRLLMLVAKHLNRLVHNLLSLIGDLITLEVRNTVLFVVDDLEVGKVLVIVKISD